MLDEILANNFKINLKNTEFNELLKYILFEFKFMNLFEFKKKL